MRTHLSSNLLDISICASLTDFDSLIFIGCLSNQLELDGFSKEEINYAIKRVYSKRVKKYECKEQLVSKASHTAVEKHPPSFFILRLFHYAILIGNAIWYF